MTDRRQNAREVRPPVGTELNAKSWLTEAPLRMLMNNLHPDVAENPDELVVYGGIGRAARDWNSFGSRPGRPFPEVGAQPDHFVLLLDRLLILAVWPLWDCPCI